MLYSMFIISYSNQRENIKMTEENNTIAVQDDVKPVEQGGIFSGDMVAFENAQRVAKGLCSSSIVPKDYQGNIGNTLIAMEIANRTNNSPMTVMQNVHIIHGKPSWSSQFVIAAINSCGLFKHPLRFRMEGEGMSLSCIAWTRCKEYGDIIEGPKISMQMAQQEGWLNKSGSKWKTMPELMIQYRAAKFFGNLNVPHIFMGMHTDTEQEDIKASQQVNEQPKQAFVPAQKRAPEPQAEVVINPIQEQEEF
jgi:hypothetical protein